MAKTYKGYELIKAIEDGQIAEGTRFRVIPTVGCIAVLENRTIHFVEGNKRQLTLTDFLNYTFEIIYTIEEQQDIDIQEIEEIKVGQSVSDKINEILQAVKQLDKKLP